MALSATLLTLFAHMARLTLLAALMAVKTLLTSEALSWHTWYKRPSWHKQGTFLALLIQKGPHGTLDTWGTLLAHLTQLILKRHSWHYWQAKESLGTLDAIGNYVTRGTHNIHGIPGKIGTLLVFLPLLAVLALLTPLTPHALMALSAAVALLALLVLLAPLER